MKSVVARAAGIAVACCMLNTVACARTKDASLSVDSAANGAPSGAATANANASTSSPPNSAWTVTEYGIGALRADMPYKAAVDSLKGALVADPGANLSECDYVKWRGAPPGVLVMVSEGKIGRVDIDSAGVTTREGAGVGSTDAQIRAMYAGRVESSPHKYTDGHYLTIKSNNPADSMFRIIFESENGKVTRFHAGVMPAVEYAEGCS